MAVIGAVEHAGAGGAGALGQQGVLRSFYSLFIEGHPHIVIGTGKNGLAAVDDGLGRREDFLHADGEGICFTFWQLPEVVQGCIKFFQKDQQSLFT